MSEFVHPWCYKCGDNFPMREGQYEELEECGNTFYCPKGHALEVSRKDIVLTMRREKRRGDCHRDTCDRLQKRIEGLRGVKTKYLNRLLRGECPYCGKTVGQMVLHIQNSHALKNNKNT